MPLLYRRLEHTSDVQVEIYGDDLASLFSNAALCLFDLMLERTQVRELESLPIELAADSLAELLLDWLRELLFLFSARSWAVARVRIDSITATRVKATVLGEQYDVRRHGLKIEVKTPTYHEYRIDKTPEGYQATVILDV
ncbi:archease [candidate division WOR-3 bacterium]|nr:archease [candidate division WOR-3 bacterium]